MLKAHLAGANIHQNGEHGQRLFEMIVALRTGEAFLFCPTALLDTFHGDINRLQDGFIRIKIRARCSTDGGRSIMASDNFAVSVVENQPVSSVVRPYARPTYTIPPRRPIANKNGNPATPSLPADPAGYRMQTRSMALNPIQELFQSAAPISTAIPTGPTHGNPHATSSSGRDLNQVSQAQVLTSLREEVNYLLREDSTRMSFEQVRSATIRTLNLSPNFFKMGEWVKLSRNTIHSQMVRKFFYFSEAAL